LALLGVKGQNKIKLKEKVVKIKDAFLIQHDSISFPNWLNGGGEGEGEERGKVIFMNVVV
jgi:hypothetical protein